MPITTEAQRELLNEIRQYAPSSSLVPAHMSYAQYLSHRKYVLGGIGLRSTHGLRYFYAQQRYIILSKGLLPPRLGGPKHSNLTVAEKALDLSARQVVSSELGHVRIDIVRTYLGCLLYTSPSPRDQRGSRMPSSA